MANFRVWCRTDEVGPNQFLAVVTSIPDGMVATASTARIESESRLVTSRARAIEECAHMSVSLADRIRKRGDVVTLIESV